MRIWPTASRSCPTSRTGTQIRALTTRSGAAYVWTRGPGNPMGVTPLLRIPLCPNPNRKDSQDDPCYVLTMLRHDAPPGSNAPPQGRSWWLVKFSTKRNDGLLNAPWWRNRGANAGSDAEQTGSRTRRRPWGQRAEWLMNRLRTADAAQINDVLKNSVNPINADNDPYWCWLMEHDPGGAPHARPGGIAKAKESGSFSTGIRLSTRMAKVGGEPFFPRRGAHRMQQHATVHVKQSGQHSVPRIAIEPARCRTWPTPGATACRRPSNSNLTPRRLVDPYPPSRHQNRAPLPPLRPSNEIVQPEDSSQDPRRAPSAERIRYDKLNFDLADPKRFYFTRNPEDPTHVPSGMLLPERCPRRGRSHHCGHDVSPFKKQPRRTSNA